MFLATGQGRIVGFQIFFIIIVFYSNYYSIQVQIIITKLYTVILLRLQLAAAHIHRCGRCDFFRTGAVGAIFFAPHRTGAIGYSVNMIQRR